ncbi:uncharacterized protein LOC123270566 [Cotesia glomerata]|uniref:Uncharacterized protein n=1 Tax=Cotesia glomerata TaxID=32391 RepID=A0AAV7IHI9_COTGL|nr:uncharacterized protein LOC123270566 [Cotesia glomerata]KAH0551939.1 hypothetical protein KQX54_003289 [Cotesia glomerata]
MLLKNCCLCISLRVGVLAACVFSIVVSIVALLSAPITYGYDCQGVKHTDNYPTCEWADVKLGLTVVISIINMMIKALVICASQQNLHELLLKTIIIDIFLWGGCITYIVYSIAIILLTNLKHQLLCLAVVGPIMALCTYMWIIFFSRYQEIRKLQYGSKMKILET